MSLKHALLAILVRQEQTGYDIAHRIGESIGFFWKATHQQIYQELSRLQQEGCVQYREVKQTSRPGKKIYKITDTGVAELKIWVTKESEPPLSKDPFLIKFFVGELVSADLLLKELAHQREIQTQRLAFLRHIEETFFPEKKELPFEAGLRHLTLRRGILNKEMWLSWALEAEQFLRDRQTEETATP